MNSQNNQWKWDKNFQIWKSQESLCQRSLKSHEFQKESFLAFSDLQASSYYFFCACCRILSYGVAQFGLGCVVWEDRWSHWMLGWRKLLFGWWGSALFLRVCVSGVCVVVLMWDTEEQLEVSFDSSKQKLKKWFSIAWQLPVLASRLSHYNYVIIQWLLSIFCDLIHHALAIVVHLCDLVWALSSLLVRPLKCLDNPQIPTYVLFILHFVVIVIACDCSLVSRRCLNSSVSQRSVMWQPLCGTETPDSRNHCMCTVKAGRPPVHCDIAVESVPSPSTLTSVSPEPLK